MPRGRRRQTASPDLDTLKQQLAELRQRQTEVKREIRRMRSGGGNLRKLEEKLEKQLATAKWTVGLIHEIQPEWDDLGFYQTVRARRPTPRGRRPRARADQTGATSEA